MNIITHIGVGNFHRSHQETYLNDLLKNDPTFNWRYVGIGMLQSDERTLCRLRREDFKYHVVSLHDSDISTECVHTLEDMILFPEHPDECLWTLCDPMVKIVSITITEYGYTLQLTDDDYALIGHFFTGGHLEIGSLSSVTTFGLILAGLACRFITGTRPFTVMSCDNINGNGDICREKCIRAVSGLGSLAAFSTFATWIRDEVKFPNTMVDRITPALNDVEALKLESSLDVMNPVICERYRAWVIEDSFVDGLRPPWEDVGAELTDDVKVYEELKLSLLNVPHSFLAYLGISQGYVHVHEVVKNNDNYREISCFMDEVIKTIERNEKNANIDYEGYAHTVLERFANEALKDTLVRIASDGVSKFKAQGRPILMRGLSQGYKMEYFAKYLRLWGQFEPLVLRGIIEELSVSFPEFTETLV